MIFLGAPNDPGVFGSWLLSCWQSDNSICNVSAGANWTCCGAIKFTCINKLWELTQLVPGLLTLDAVKAVQAGPSV